jgi:hypothetical protein
MALSQFGGRAAASPAAHPALRNRWFAKRGLFDLRELHDVSWQLLNNFDEPYT